MDDNPALTRRKAPAASLYADYAKSEGDSRSFEALRDEASRKYNDLRERGFDLGNDHRDESETLGDDRMKAIYNHARRALYTSFDDSVLAEASARHLRVLTRARDREDYLSHPAAGERIAIRMPPSCRRFTGRGALRFR